jgi:protein tyrosine phosphatase (PTP) superfamily phosphohydrolase (DUF442 family)
MIPAGLRFGAAMPFDRRLPFALLLGGLAFLAGVGRAPDRPAPGSFAAVAVEGIENAHRLTPKVVAGAAPEGDASFESLRKLGIKTVISVDGATPDVAAARRHGLRYVHLPIGYDDVAPEEGLAIAKAIDELPGPIYVHCHHGKHRSAAAVAVACVVGGHLEPGQAESVLKTFGTGENYKGLWASARAARPVEKSVLDAVKADYVETSKVPPMAEAMVAIDQTLDRLKLAAASGWRAPPGHPDVDPPHEALQLAEKLRELGRTDDVRRERPDAFRALLGHGEGEAQSLRDALAAWSKRGKADKAPASLNVALQKVTSSCAACHKAYRD